VAKRQIDIEDGLVEQAREALGTTTLKDTVTVALRQAVDGGQRPARLDEEELQRFAVAAEDIGDERVTAAASESRPPQG
jgi:Arc/MetJ family transcription regulator